MSKSITIPFKLPFGQKLLKRAANLFNVEIIEKVTAQEIPGAKISRTSYIHTIPEQTIEARHMARRHKAGVESFQPGFHMKGAIAGYIFYVDGSGRICEIEYEMLVGSEYDIGLFSARLTIPSPKFVSVRRTPICGGACSSKNTIYGSQKVRFQNWRRY